MALVRLYGKGAVVLQHDKGVYRSGGGFIDVPDTMVPQVLSMGFKREPFGGVIADEPEDTGAASLYPGIPTKLVEVPDFDGVADPDIGTAEDLAKVDATTDAAIVVGDPIVAELTKFGVLSNLSTE